jgi:hypothetical protein
LVVCKLPLLIVVFELFEVTFKRPGVVKIVEKLLITEFELNTSIFCSSAFALCDAERQALQ